MPSIGQENLETVMIDFFGAPGAAISKPRRGCSILTLAGRVCARSGSVTAARR